MPLILSKEEKEILNKEIYKRQVVRKQEEALYKSNNMVKPIIKKLINLGAKLIIPLFLITLAISCWTISWVVKNRVFIGIFGLVKFVILYITISVATNSAFGQIGLRLKRSVINLFIFLQMLIYLIIDSTYIWVTLIEGDTIEALLHVLSPKILTIAIFVILALFMLMINYNKLRERNASSVFVGWYIVISTTITLVIILLELLLSTILMTFFKDVMF